MDDFTKTFGLEINLVIDTKYQECRLEIYKSVNLYIIALTCLIVIADFAEAHSDDNFCIVIINNINESNKNLRENIIN